MREHQIVITLKPDQFAQIQQMTKAAGAKSMGIFVRKTLLAALEIEGVKPTLGASPNAPVADPSLLVDLQRMHNDLKELISESLLAVQDESFDPFGDLVAELGLAEDYSDAEDDATEDDEETPLSKEEPIASSIKVKDPLADLLDEKLKTRLESYLEHKRTESKRATPFNVADTRKEPESQPISQSISNQDETPKKAEEKPAKPRPSLPRSIPPDPLPREDKTGFSERSSPLSGNPPPKKPKH